MARETASAADPRGRTMLLACFTLLAVGLAGCDGTLPFQRGPETHATALLWSDPPELWVEVHHVEGREPSTGQMDRLRQELDTLTAKRTVRMEPPARIDIGDASQSRTWTPTEIRALHEQTRHRDSPSAGWDRQRAYLHVMYLDGIGEGANDTRFVGLHTGPTLVVLPDHMQVAFAGTVVGGLVIGPPNPAAEQAVEAVLVHELGHALGLVGLEAPVLGPRQTSEEDDPCACHSRDEDSVMFPGAESFNPRRFVEEGRFTRDTFTAEDLADIAALRDAEP